MSSEHWSKIYSIVCSSDIKFLEENGLINAYSNEAERLTKCYNKTTEDTEKIKLKNIKLREQISNLKLREISQKELYNDRTRYNLLNKQCSMDEEKLVDFDKHWEKRIEVRRAAMQLRDSDFGAVVPSFKAYQKCEERAATLKSELEISINQNNKIQQSINASIAEVNKNIVNLVKTIVGYNKNKKLKLQMNETLIINNELKKKYEETKARTAKHNIVTSTQKLLDLVNRKDSTININEVIQPSLTRRPSFNQDILKNTTDGKSASMLKEFQEKERQRLLQLESLKQKYFLKGLTNAPNVLQKSAVLAKESDQKKVEILQQVTLPSKGTLKRNETTDLTELQEENKISKLDKPKVQEAKIVDQKVVNDELNQKMDEIPTPVINPISENNLMDLLKTNKTMEKLEKPVLETDLAQKSLKAQTQKEVSTKDVLQKFDIHQELQNMGMPFPDKVIKNLPLQSKYFLHNKENVEADAPMINFTDSATAKIKNNGPNIFNMEVDEEPSSVPATFTLSAQNSANDDNVIFKKPYDPKLLESNWSMENTSFNFEFGKTPFSPPSMELDDNNNENSQFSFGLFRF